jgi:hypothetical protein
MTETEKEAILQRLSTTIKLEDLGNVFLLSRSEKYSLNGNFYKAR